MGNLLGFYPDIWDYITFLVFCCFGIAAIVIAVFILGLPGRIAIARKHPDAEAVKIMGWAGFLLIVPWVKAFMWAIKPTDVIDIRYLPKQLQQHTDEEINKLKNDGI